jgi:tetratricopeptide (TPR) repeat protein
VAAQKSDKIVQEITNFTFPQHVVFACYGFIAYLYKLVVPIHLSAYYPYPVKDGADIPIQYYAFVILVLGLAALVYFSLRYSKKLFFSIAFYAITIFLVLQLLPVGGALMADRYCYIPSIGIFYLAGEGFYYVWNKKQKWIALAVLGIITILFSIKTYSRAGVWKNDLSLWEDVIRQDQSIPHAYYNRGVAYMNEGNSDKALEDFNKTIELKPAYTQAYVNKGNILRDQDKHDEAINAYNKALELNANLPIAYFNRGTLYMNEGKNEEALNDFNKAIELNSQYYKAYSNRGIVYFNQQKYAEAINDYTSAIDIKNDYYEAYFNRGMAEYSIGNLKACCEDLQVAADLGFKQAADAVLQFCK